MNVPTITMDPNTAGERADEYEDKGTTEEDAAIARGFRELEEGRELLSLRSVFADVERDELLRPRLAIARADRRQVRYSSWSNSGVDSFDTDWRSHAGRSIADRLIEVPRGAGVPRNNSDGYALVPLVPPAIRTRRNLTKYFILWEVERWAEREVTATPDRDPFLLKRLDEDLFSIVAQWDLTPLEQAILGRRIIR